MEWTRLGKHLLRKSTVSTNPGQLQRAGRTVHPAFGMWADREETRDPSSFAAELRRKLEQRADSRG